MTTAELEIKGKRLIIETGQMARQSGGAVVTKYGDTVVLATAVADKRVKEGLDFFPLTVDYQEKTYSAGKIPGGFFKREGKPSEKEVLTSRLIDRPLRPLFPKGFYSETQVIVSVLSYGEENVSDILGVIGASAAVHISDIPFGGPVGAVRVGRLDGALVINPDLAESDSLDLNLVVAGTADAVIMVEGGGAEVSETVLLEAIDFAHQEIKRIVGLQNELKEKVGKEKRPVTPVEESAELKAEVRAFVAERMKEAIRIPGKLRRQEALDIVLEDAIKHLNTPEKAEKLFGDAGKDLTRDIANLFDGYEKEIVRNTILQEGVRSDNRKPDEIRHISCHMGFLPRAHGSALFIRGETQALVASTLGTADDEQKIDSLEGEMYKTFMLHYNFPPFSVGEVKPLRSPGRREIGHGALAERALKYVIPSKEVFPYTIRIVSDILESNGSSSMATVCGATLSLMDAGVPIAAPVAGIAMGLIKEGDQVVVLTDILGLEDHLGDMDFKVAGTENGITAFQMDVKIGGVSREIMQNALEQARRGRLHILGKMKEAMPSPRAGLSPHAPRIYTLKIKQEKIRDVIGTGGKVIRGIIEQTGVKIDIDDSGTVNIASSDEASAQKAIEIINGIIAEAELNKIYKGKVVRITDFGAFVEILPGVDGLLHISQISEKRVAKVTDELNVGDEVLVKVIEIDNQGRVRLSRKEAMREQGK
ncbi:MAG: polyribonucleotide nucleotidyltransferase [Alphaproteobacteria bacterium]|uniref:Polyribonucleotide nucleotidyltransferase n=1 Tax=Candidatus Nitrobium versatile TaxID=2884831 RepID=A0A953J7P3_9BACT|nr:polyribonucleotide nucleotidyltransferase [Candidatus Nitrobium versatile]